ncbi:MAG: putative photosynthetic complex assembly protein PuhE [Pseudomonadota bacterium]|nr:putative photosynthetic complex assembly protein PuhE [Pseudomonadota bacterium]
MGVDAAAAGYALFVWWFSTGVILVLDLLPRRTYRWSMLFGTAVFAVCLWRLAAGASDTSLAGTYAAFTYAVLAWGWQEMSFFMGVVTGPRRVGCRPDATLGQRFRDGVAACLYHELAIIVTAAVVVTSTWGAPNQVGTWTFMVLWGMRQSAKLNVFLGVRNLGERFLPPHLRYLRTYMDERPMNLLMPVSITAGTVLVAMLAVAAGQPGISGATAAGLTFVATMLALAVLEHWMLVLPIPFERLWVWALAIGQPRKARDAKQAGFRNHLWGSST